MPNYQKNVYFYYEFFEDGSEIGIGNQGIVYQMHEIPNFILDLPIFKKNNPLKNEKNLQN